MARMTSIVASVIRGSVGGITYTANQYHQIIMRHRTAPVQPGTQAQTILRTSFASASAHWKNSLDQAQRDAWDAYADTCFYQGPLGQYTVSGREIFIAGEATAAYLRARGAAVTTPNYDAPVIPGFAGILIGVPLPPGPGQTGFVVPITNVDTQPLTVFSFRSIAFSASRQRYKGPFLTSTLQYTAVNPGVVTMHTFEPLVLGSAYFCNFRAIVSNSAHRISPLFNMRSLALLGA